MKRLLPVLMIAGVFACLPLAAPSAPKTPATTTAAVKYDFAANSSAMGNQLMLELRKQSKDSNIVISPVSIHLALSMLANGADQATLDEITKILGTDAAGLQALNEAAEDFLAGSVSADPKFEISLANALFSQKGYQLAPTFLRTLQKHMQARAKELDFEKDMKGAIDAINQWVDRQTNGKIPKLFDTLDPDTKLVLASALYLKANWRKTFKKHATTNSDFHVTSTATIKVPTMSENGGLPYLETPKFQAVSLHYTDLRYQMYVFLPKQGTSVDDLVSTLTPAALAKHCSQFKPEQGQLYLPRVNVSCSFSLGDQLKQLGMKLAFEPAKADLGKLFAPKAGNQTQLSIDEVVHKTKLVVDEDGTEAAAVTAIVSVGASAAPKNAFTMNVNRPYLMMIRDDDTGAILFMAVIADPSK